MATLKALPDKLQMISGKGDFFYPQAESFVEELKEYSSASSQYTVISIIGPQSSGKSYLLNTLFGTKFDVLNAKGGRKQTTQGIWIAKCVTPCMIIMDVEGLDGNERGEDDTLFEKQSALFSLTVSDVLLLNMMFTDIGRVQGASYGLLKLIFEERVNIEEQKKTTVIILVRDHDYLETSPDITKKHLERSMNELWHKVHATTKSKMSDYIQVIVKDFPHKNHQPQQFAQKSKDLAEYLSFAASGSLEHQNHRASSFAYSSQRIWRLICDNKKLSAADHKLAMSYYNCNEIKEEILCSFDQDKGYRSLMSGTSISVKEFNTELRSFLERILTRYEEKTRAFDGNTRKQLRDKLEEKTLQEFKPTFVKKIFSLRNKILADRKSVV